MKNYFTLILLLTTILVASCSRLRKFDSVEATENERYNIVFNDGKCGFYDNNADSHVTLIKYDALKKRSYIYCWRK